MTERPDAPRPRVAVLADDLIWATRLADMVRRAGGEPVRIATPALLRAALRTLDGCVVDLGARGFDGIDAVRLASSAQVPCAAVGAHVDGDERRAAQRAGAVKVWVYKALFDHGDRALGGWVAGLRPTEEEPR